VPQEKKIPKKKEIRAVRESNLLLRQYNRNRTGVKRKREEEKSREGI